MEKMPQLMFVSWEEFYDLSYQLAGKIKTEGRQFDLIVSISRGGHVVSRILSDLLDLPIFNVGIQSYKTLEQKRLMMTQKLSVFLDDQSVLLVDEIVDTGESLKRALKYLERIRCKRIFSAALHVKPHATTRPDLLMMETDKWVVFPYEVRETYDALMSIGAKLGVGSQEVKQAMIQGGMKEKYLNGVISS